MIAEFRQWLRPAPSHHTFFGMLDSGFKASARPSAPELARALAHAAHMCKYSASPHSMVHLRKAGHRISSALVHVQVDFTLYAALGLSGTSH